jgi:F-type H+-transporting ATPase subunit b
MEAILDILGKIGFDWRMALFNFINFVIIFWIIKRYTFEPTVRFIEERKKHAQETEENYQQSKTELAMAEHKAQSIIDDAKVEANKIIEASADEARIIAEKMKDKAKSEIELLVTQAKKNIEIDRKDMQEKLKEETVDLVIQTTKAVLGTHIDSKIDERLITDAIVK